MANKIQLRRDTLANWEAVNPILGDGEPGFVIDTNQVKYGDGSTPWNDLGWGSAGLNPTSVAIGRLAGETNQSNSSVAVGPSAGQFTQGEWATAVGSYAGRTAQGSEAVSVGDEAGYYHQGYGAVAVGGYGEWEGGAGSNSQGHDAVAIGASAGNNNQGAFAIAIGSGAGYSYQTTGSIAILAGQNSGNIGINNAGLYIDPIRNDLTSTNLALYYDATTKEITYNTVITPVPNALINGTHSVTLDSDGALTGDGANGNFYIDTITSTGTTSTWVFGVNGKLTLPVGGDIVDSNNVSVLGGSSSAPVIKLANNLSGVIQYDASTGTTWMHSYPTSNFTANFVNLPITSNSIIECKLIIQQGQTTGIPNIIQIEGNPVSSLWNGGTPEGYLHNTDEITIKLMKINDTWYDAMGSLTTYGQITPRNNTLGPAGRFLVMGIDSFFTSIDGVSWSRCNSLGPQTGGQTASVDPSDGRIWTAGDFAGYAASNKVYTSDLFGSAWAESGTLPVSKRWSGALAYGSSVVVWETIIPTTVYASTDTGATWSIATTNTGSFYMPSFGYSAATNRFLAVDNSASFTSTNGVSWTKNGSIGVTGYAGQIASGGGKLVAVGNSGVVYSTDNGSTWQNGTYGFSWPDARGAAYGNGRWVAVAYDVGLTYGVLSSEDGIAWTTQTIFTSEPLWDIEFGNGIFLVRGINGGTYVSTTGLSGSWTTATPIGSYGSLLTFVPSWE